MFRRGLLSEMHISGRYYFVFVLLAVGVLGAGAPDAKADDALREQLFRFSIEWLQSATEANADLNWHSDGQIDHLDLYGLGQVERYGGLLPTHTPAPTATITPTPTATLTPTPTPTLGPTPKLLAPLPLPHSDGSNPSVIARRGGGYLVTYDRGERVWWADFDFDGSPQDSGDLGDDSRSPAASEDRGGEIWIAYVYENEWFFGKDEGLVLYCGRTPDSRYWVREGRERNPAIAVDRDGVVAMVWEDEEYDPDHCLLRFAEYDSGLDKVNLYDPRFLSNNSSRETEFPAIAVNTNSEFLAVWIDEDRQIKGRYFTAYQFSDKDLVLSEADRNVRPKDPKVAALSDDFYLVVWEDHRDGDAGRIYGRLVSGVGQLVGETDFRIDDRPGAATRPAVTAFEDRGLFLVVWGEACDSGQQLCGLFLDARGDPQGPSFSLIEGVQSLNELDVAASQSFSGEFVLVWQDGSALQANLYSTDF